MFHMLMLFLNKFSLLLWNVKIWLKISEFMKILIWKVILFMTYGVYIRIILETNQYILISSINEINQSDVASTLKIISFIFSIIIIIFWIFLIGITIFLTFSSYSKDEIRHNKIGELFLDIKNGRYKIYIPILLIRRFTFVSILVIFATTYSLIVNALLWFLQLAYLIYMIVLRPFETSKSNIIEIMNEIYFIFLLGWILYFNSESTWNDRASTIYISVLLSNNVFAFIIIWGKQSVNFIENSARNIIKRWWSKSTLSHKKYIYLNYNK